MPTFKVSSDITVQCNKCKQLKKKKITLNGYYERYSDKEKIHEAYDHAYKELSKTEDKTIAEGIVCSNCERLENFYIYELQPGDRLIGYNDNLICIVINIHSGKNNHKVIGTFHMAEINAYTLEPTIKEHNSCMSFKTQSIESWYGICKVWRDGEIIWAKK
jgi:hypothetical protein